MNQSIQPFGSRSCPPWRCSPHYLHFVHDRVVVCGLRQTSKLISVGPAAGGGNPRSCLQQSSNAVCGSQSLCRGTIARRASASILARASSYEMSAGELSGSSQPAA